MRVVIVGGGISGLTVAHRLRQLSREPLDLTVVEARERFGGVIETIARDGFLLERGPDAFLAEKPWARELCRDVGLGEELIETQREHRRSFLVHHGMLQPVPEGFYLLAPSRWSAVFGLPFLSWPGRLRMACEPLVPARRRQDDESVASFIRRRFGREALARIGQPMLAGIYTADPERLSLQATMPAFLEMERRHGSVLRALAQRARDTNGHLAEASGPRYSLFLSLRRGMGSLIEALLRHLPGVTLLPASPVERLARAGVGWTLTLRGGRSLQAERLCLALPAPQAAGLLAPCAGDLARLLKAIPYEPVATVNLGVRQQDVPLGVAGFGFVVPAAERRRLIGCTFASLKFAQRAPQDAVLLRAFVGGAGQRDLAGLEDAAMIQVVREELRSLLGLTAEPLTASVSRFPEAMPQYHVGHLARIAAIEEAARRCPGLFLTGNGFRGLGLPDCIHHARATAERMLA